MFILFLKITSVSDRFKAIAKLLYCFIASSYMFQKCHWFSGLNVYSNIKRLRHNPLLCHTISCMSIRPMLHYNKLYTLNFKHYKLNFKPSQLLEQYLIIVAQSGIWRIGNIDLDIKMSNVVLSQLFCKPNKYSYFFKKQSSVTPLQCNILVLKLLYEILDLKHKA